MFNWASLILKSSINVVTTFLSILIEPFCKCSLGGIYGNMCGICTGLNLGDWLCEPYSLTDEGGLV